MRSAFFADFVTVYDVIALYRVTQSLLDLCPVVDGEAPRSCSRHLCSCAVHYAKTSLKWKIIPIIFRNRNMSVNSTFD